MSKKSESSGSEFRNKSKDWNEAFDEWEQENAQKESLKIKPRKSAADASRWIQLNK